MVFWQRDLQLFTKGLTAQCLLRFSNPSVPLRFFALVKDPQQENRGQASCCGGFSWRRGGFSWRGGSFSSWRSSMGLHPLVVFLACVVISRSEILLNINDGQATTVSRDGSAQVTPSMKLPIFEYDATSLSVSFWFYFLFMSPIIFLLFRVLIWK